LDEIREYCRVRDVNERPTARDVFLKASALVHG
jgi:hypothetical protein